MIAFLQDILLPAFLLTCTFTAYIMGCWIGLREGEITGYQRGYDAAKKENHYQ